MLETIRQFFSRSASDAGAGGSPVGSDVQVAACALLLELAHADGEFSPEERQHIEDALGRHFGLEPAATAELIALAGAERERSIDHFRFTRLINQQYDLGQKMVLAEVMWGLILSDGRIADHEAYLVRKLGNLLELEPAYLSQARRAAQPAAGSSGSIARLSLKPKIAGEVGLPKRSVPVLQVSPAGAEGDYNNYRATQLAGDPDQALLLVTEELLARLNADGWPVAPGDLGENLTLAGIPESGLAPGVRLEAGAVRLEISKPCDPCTELYTLPYVGKERGPAFLKATAGRRGWYARVLAPGEIAVGAAVRLSGQPAEM